jgi:tetratricopeptide (TPR) repeat protein
MTDVAARPSMFENALAQICSTLRDTPVTWLSAPPAEADAITRSLAAQWRADGGDYWQADQPNAEGSGFGPLRSVMRQVLPLADAEPELLQECAPELVALLPDLASRPDFAEAPPLAELVPMPLALARMLPQESEYVFRLITRAGWLVTRACRRSESAGKQPLVVFNGLERCDRLTILAIYHLCLRASAGDMRLLLIGSDVPQVEGISRHGLFDAEFERRSLLARLFQRVRPAQLAVAGPPGASGNSPSGSDDEASEDPGADDVRAALALGSRYGNIEAVLKLARRTLSRGHLERELVVDVWQTVGIAHATVGNFGEALQAFSHAMEEAADSVLRARQAMFLALVCAKRTADFAEAVRYLEHGYRAIDGLESPTVALERGWLNNVAALVAYRQGDRSRAVAITLETLRTLKPLMDEESTALKTNLVTNYSILLEQMGDLTRARHAWQLFRVFLGQASHLFSKRYYFREAGLQYRAGRLEQAAVAYREAFHAAGLVGDVVGLEAAARACAHLAERQRDYASALEWTSRIPPLLDRLGDAPRRAATDSAIAAYQHRLQGAASDETLMEPPSTSLHLPQHLVMP